MLAGGPIIKAGHFQADGNTYELNLGFVPNYIRLYNLNAATGEVAIYEYFGDMGDRMLTSPGLAMGSTKSKVGYSGFTYIIGGKKYTKAANATGETPGNDVIPQNKYGAVALDIGIDGVVDIVEASGNATGYNSAAAARAGCAAPAPGHVRMGYVTVTKSDGQFTFGTTNFDAENVTAAFSSCLENAIARRMLADSGTTGAKTIENLLTLGANPSVFSNIARLEKGDVQATDPILVTPQRGVTIDTAWMDDDDEIYFVAFGNAAEVDIGDVA